MRVAQSAALPVSRPRVLPKFPDRCIRADPGYRGVRVLAWGREVVPVLPEQAQIGIGCGGGSTLGHVGESSPTAPANERDTKRDTYCLKGFLLRYRYRFDVQVTPDPWSRESPAGLRSAGLFLVPSPTAVDHYGFCS